MVAPEEACQNLERLAAEGFETRYGFYEAIDYTPSRLPPGQSSAVVRSFMAHHQGMSLLSLAHLLLDRPMQKRFESDPLFQATMLLLQERIPKATAFYAHTTELSEHHMASGALEMPIRVFSSPDTPNPEVQLLSNGRYHVMVTNAGGGYSRWKDLAITRWREDRTRDNWGTFCYIRDVTSRAFWSTAYQPTLKRSKQFEAIFSEGRAEFRVATTTMTPIPRSLFRPRMTSNCAACASPTARGRAARSRLPVMRKWFWRRRRRRTASGVQQSVRADRDPRPAARDPLHAKAPLPGRASALDVAPDGRAWGGSETSPMRPTACGSSAAATPSPIHRQ
jgi:hypothetical protein